MKLKSSLAIAAVTLTAASAAVSGVQSFFGDPVPGLTSSQSAAFSGGKTEFASQESVADGLGPVFNGRACGECHNQGAIGGGSERVVTRFGTITNGAFDPLAQYGGSLIQDHAIGTADGSTYQFSPETVPAAATIVAHRRTTPLFGLGYVDAVPDQTFADLAAQEVARGDGTAGHVNMVYNISAGMNTVGKFGWKAQVPTLFQFAGDAYLNEMGITNPQFPNENCPGGDCSLLAHNPVPALNDTGDGVQAFADFMTMLGAPPRGTINGDVTAGESTFVKIGCDACHVSSLRTGSSPVAALSNQTFHPYSDFLVHDMGSLGDGIAQAQAGMHEMRTAPLWGLRLVTRYLHDGRAGTVDEAILAHDGQARAARDRYAALDANAKSKLLSFLGSL